MSESSKAFADFAEGSYSWRFIERPALDRALPPSAYSEAAKILDIGCGSGRVISYHIQRGALQEHITGIEPDEPSVALCRQRFPNARLITQKVQDVELEKASVDIVSAQLSLRYVDDIAFARVLDHTYQALRPGGLFFLLDAHPARYGINEGFEAYFKEGPRAVATPWGGHETYFYRTIGTYVTSVASSGFKIESLDECPIADEGTAEAYSVDFARYNASPARFAILATKLPAN